MDEHELHRIVEALAKQHESAQGLELLLSLARRLVRAEAGTIYLREGNCLRCAATRNDVLTRLLGTEEFERRLKANPLTLTEPSIAGFVAVNGSTVNVPDVYAIPPDRPYRFDRRFDATTGYRTRSILAVALHDGHGAVFGVLQLINALNEVGGVIAFNTKDEAAVAAVLAAVSRGLHS